MLSIPRTTLRRELQKLGVKEYDDLLYDTEPDGIESPESSFVKQRITTSVARNLKVVYFGDIHAPFQDDRAISVTAQIIADFRPDEVVCGGDSVDFYAVSSFDRDPERVLKLQEELDIAFGCHETLTSAARSAQWYMLDANHEERWVRYLHSHPEISSLRVLELYNLLRFNELGWKVGGAERRYCNGLLALIHGARYSKHAGWAIKAEMHDRFFDHHVLQLHNHKVGSYISHGPLRQMSGYEVGCLCSLEPEWHPHPNWNQGIMLVEIIENVPSFNNLIFHADGNTVWSVFGGKVYKS